MAARRPVVALAIFSAIVLGCSSGRDQSAALTVATGARDSASPSLQDMVGSRPPDAESAAAAARPRTFDLCRLLPADSVTRVLRETIGKSVSVASTRPAGNCTYSDAATSKPDVQVRIDLGRDRSPGTASVALLATRGQLGSHGIATTDIQGVGDAAFGSSDTTATYTVRVQQGVVTERVTVGVKGASAQTLRPAAVALAKRTLAMLH